MFLAFIPVFFVLFASPTCGPHLFRNVELFLALTLESDGVDSNNMLSNVAVPHLAKAPCVCGVEAAASSVLCVDIPAIL